MSGHLEWSSDPLWWGINLWQALQQVKLGFAIHYTQIVKSGMWGIFIWDTTHFIVIQWSMTLYFIESQYVKMWNVIMYANVTFPLTLVSNKVNVPFFCYFIGVKIGTAFKCIFEETLPKLSVNFGNHNSQDSHKNPVLNFSFTEPQCSDKCWSKLPLKCHIFAIGNIHRRYCITSMIIRFMLLVGLFGTSYHVLYHNKTKWCHHCTSVWKWKCLAYGTAQISLMCSTV